MEQLKSKKWWNAAGTRAVKTACQTAVATIGTAALISGVDWRAVVSASAMAGLLSILTSLGGLPEVEEPKAGEGNGADGGR